MNAREFLRDLSVSDRCRRSAGLARHLTERPLELDVRGLATHLQYVERPSAIDIHVVKFQIRLTQHCFALKTFANWYSSRSENF